jgi:hypothetical protein
MNSQPHSFEDLQDRVLKLEKQNRRLKQLGFAVLVLPALLLLMGQAPSKKTVEANEFILRDNTGNVRARLAMSVVRGDGPEFLLFDAGGKPKVMLKEGLLPGLSLFDTQGYTRGAFGESDRFGIGPVLSLKG